ncbi:PIN domain nuclease, a component of toxin-antitoxin system (PIN domain) [Tistlia consotensis]|uniref:PIN domain nuclease, a component of toxin-antitoxin system (PIN domain) n=1 Tax=Tistlia consotensis USBA 355 TaxID=560819 RepID=A0A1Y6C1W5_9PROT|nr:type II toxin-antitoxin system VapC family toxin [Tistlia consotensis]SMF41147.1 PIN domain nuclease, a component of toxin-antitoxin system (PIN domain) [Tistlia consotensis USBA 355]SNR73999.1 PIN domain nuclease, a component of toxin-antitoxin system (PIN domain) [Tistlia consotensis]
MAVLLDSHVLVWWLFDAPELSAGARAAIEEADRSALVSAASLYELLWKGRIGKLPGIERLPEAVAASGFGLLAIEPRHASEAALLDWGHRDPWDRILAAQARVEGLPLVSSDRIFDEIGLPRIS